MIMEKNVKVQIEVEGNADPTNEELITDIFQSHINSYKDLQKTFIIFNGNSEMN